MNRIADGIIDFLHEATPVDPGDQCGIRESRRCSFVKRICGLECRSIRRFGGG